MKLADLHPAWSAGYPDRKGIGLWFDCPGTCCASLPAMGLNADGKAVNFDPEEGKTKKLRLHVNFVNPLDGGGRFGDDTPGRTFWQRTGESFETLTLTPSVDASGFGHWHGFIVGGEAR